MNASLRTTTAIVTLVSISSSATATADLSPLPQPEPIVPHLSLSLSVSLYTVGVSVLRLICAGVQILNFWSFPYHVHAAGKLTYGGRPYVGSVYIFSKNLGVSSSRKEHSYTFFYVGAGKQVEQNTSLMMSNKASGSKRKCEGKIRDVHTATSTVTAKARKSATCIEYGRDFTRISSSIVSRKETVTTYGGRLGKKACSTASSIASANATCSHTANRGRQGKAGTTSIASASAKAISSQRACIRGSKGKFQTSSTASANVTNFQTTCKGRKGKAGSSTCLATANATTSLTANTGRKGKVQTSSISSEMTTQFQTVGVEITSFGSKVVAEQGVIRLTSKGKFPKGRGKTMENLNIASTSCTNMDDLRIRLPEQRHELASAQTLESDLDMAFDLQMQEAITASINLSC